MADFKTNFNVFPYNDDFDPANNYYKFMFKPGVAVQVRELNGIQSLLQDQIGVFGDNVYRRGTILSGCNFTFHKPYKYVKILDSQTNGALVTPGNYLGNFAINETNGLKAYILNYQDGFEATSPDLKTLYVKYVNSGNTSLIDQFSPDDTLKIINGSYPIDDVDIVAGGAGVSNSDVVVFVSQMLVNVTSGSFTPGDTFHQTDTNANGTILSINTTRFPGKALIQVKPKDAHLTNNQVNSAAWTFTRYSSVQNDGATATGTIEQIFGSGAVANVITNSSGTITNIQMDTGGKNYTFAPACAIKTTNTSVSIPGITLTAKNYKASVKIQNSSDAIGNGYAFSVSEGYIYDLGMFLKVPEQTIIVSKYTETPNNIACGFTVEEEIIDFNKDPNLLDNIITQNESAPGADRLKLTPRLTLQSKEQSASNNEFLTLVEWNNGKPYKQNQTTQFSALGDHVAQQVYDQSGNFVMDAFQVATESTANSALDASYFTLVVDPGQAYINGRKVQTLSNYKVNLNKGLDTKLANNVVSVNYGNYVRVNEVGGGFDSANGVQVSLRSQPTQYISNNDQYATGVITGYGRELGTARIRAFTHESGKPGDANAIYRAYLFDLKMNPGESFDNVRALYYNNTYDAIADTVLEYSPQRDENVAVLKDKDKSKLLFSAGVSSLKNSNTTTYQYRTTNVVNTVVSTAETIIDLSAGSEYLPYGTDRELSSTEMRELVVTPVEHDWIMANNLPGTVSCNTTDTLVTGSGTNFLTAFEIGDFFHYIDGGSEESRRIVNILGSTSLRVDEPFSSTNTAANYKRVFPKNIPVPFGYREGLKANVDVTGQILTLDVFHSNGDPISLDATNSAIDTRVSYNVERRNTVSSLKTTNRNKYVKIAVANNEDGINGPWCIGVPDACRLRAVYHHTSNTVNVNSNDVTSHFYIDHNQNANYLNLSFLYKQPTSGLTITANSHLLVCFDYFTRDDAGYYDARSYRRTANAAEIATLDSRSFTAMSLNSAAISWEIPEVYTSDNRYYDLINTFDFRPAADATITPSSNAATAPVNPSQAVTFTGLQKFPKPDGVMTTQVEHYVGRVDDVYIGETGNIFVLKGIPETNPRRRLQSNHPKDSLRLQMINIPPYPNYVMNQGNEGIDKMSTKIVNEKGLQYRVDTRLIEPILTTRNLQTSQPMVYTMEDIGNLERRIADLEYYVSMSVLETSMSNKIIPSSIDRSLNRFKYGFFADDYSTDVYSDKNNPQYAATIEAEGDLAFGSALNPLEPKVPNPDNSDNPNNPNIVQPTRIIQKETNRAVPLKHIWGIRHITQNPLFIDEEIISQENITDRTKSGYVNRVDSCVEILSDGQIVANSYVTSVNKYRFKFYPEGISGTTTLFFDFINDNIAYDYGAKMDVIDPDGAIVATTNSTSNSVQSLTASDIIFLNNDSSASGFLDGIAKSNTANTFVRSGIDADYGKGIGKLSFTSTKSGAYTVETTTTFTQTGFKQLVVWPSLLAAESAVINTADCKVTIPDIPDPPEPPPPQPPVYIGTLMAGSLTVKQWSCSNWFRINDTNYRAFVLQGFGLKPNTVHKLYMDTQNWPFVVSIDKDDFKAAFYDPVRRNKKSFNQYNAESPVGDEGLIISTWRKVNELSRFLKQARARMVDADGNFLADSTLTTDNQGKIRCLVFFPLEIAGWFSQDFNADSYIESRGAEELAAQQPKAWQIIRRSFTQGASKYTRSNNVGRIKPTGGSSGYSSIALKDETGQSIASRIFANRTPFKIIPYDPKGNI